jgi:hypothetical protein
MNGLVTKEIAQPFVVLATSYFSGDTLASVGGHMVPG